MLFSKASQNVFRRAVCSGLGLMTPGPHPPCVISVFLESVRHCPGSWPLGPGHPAPPRVSGREPSLRRWLCLHPPGAQRLLLGGKKKSGLESKPKTAKGWPIRPLGSVPAQEAGPTSQGPGPGWERFLAHSSVAWWDAGSQVHSPCPSANIETLSQLSCALLP